MDQVPHTLPLTCSLPLEQDAADTVDSREDVGAAGSDSDESQSSSIEPKTLKPNKQNNDQYQITKYNVHFPSPQAVYPRPMHYLHDF